MAPGKKRTSTISKSGMILWLLLSSLAWGEDLTHHQLGKITQMSGEVTFYPYLPPREVNHLDLTHNLREGGSYLTHPEAYFTAKLFDGSWLRVSPGSKFAVEFNPTQKELIFNLYSGSLKVLFSPKLNKGELQKIIINSGDGRFETSEGKFSVFRNILENACHVYVEKGLVFAARQNQEDKNHKLVHTQETVSIKDREDLIEPARQITEKELRFLHSAFYLKNNKSSF
jgi:hypothetical protein